MSIDFGCAGAAEWSGLTPHCTTIYPAKLQGRIYIQWISSTASEAWNGLSEGAWTLEVKQKMLIIISTFALWIILHFIHSLAVVVRYR